MLPRETIDRLRSVCSLRFELYNKRHCLESHVVKRLFDVLVSFTALVLLSPLLVLIALIIKLTSSGPVFYRGERISLGGRVFRIFKFRSMVVNADKIGGSSTSERDVRVTAIGKFIRKFKIDELPQLLNVLFGDMSLVGPRPEVKWCVDMYTEEEKAILTVRPGITDWASIRFHNEGEIIAQSGIKDADQAYLTLIRPEKLRLQLKYVRERSFWKDFLIILQTVSRLFTTRFMPAAQGNIQCMDSAVAAKKDA